MKHVTLTIEFDVEEDDLAEHRGNDSFEHALDGLRTDLEFDVKADWPGENFKVTAEVEVEPAPKPSKTPGHVITVLHVNLDPEKNDLAGRIVTCSCGRRWGVDGLKAQKPFRSAPLAGRVGDVHLHRVEHGIKED